MLNLLKKIALIGLLSCIVFMAAHHTIFFKETQLDRMTAKITYPLYCFAGKIAQKINNFTEKRVSYSDLEAKYKKLYQDYMALIDDIIALQASQRNYAHSKELAEFKERYNLDNAVTAKILVKNVTPDAHYFLINRGTRDGLHKDMIAFYQRHIIGRISDVYDFYSKVTLITDQYCKVSIYTGKTKAPGILQGFNSINRCTISYVSHLFKVQNNDLVISSGQGLVFPEGFCLGKIVLNSLQEKSLYHYIEVEPMVNLASLTHCLVADGRSIKPF